MGYRCERLHVPLQTVHVINLFQASSCAVLKNWNTSEMQQCMPNDMMMPLLSILPHYPWTPPSHKMF